MRKNTSVLGEFIEDPYASGRFENLGCQGLPADVYAELLRVAADKHVSVYYLAAIYKRGHADARATTTADAASRAGSMYLECPCCGDEGAESDSRGFFHDGQKLICGCPGWVTCEEDGASWINNGDAECQKCGKA